MSKMRLSERLQAMAWIRATGKREFVPLTSELERFGVRTGTPETADTNNGMAVVYDEEGHAWVKPRRAFTQKDAGLFPFGCRMGAHVPFSNDGGRWADIHWPR